MEPVHCRWEEVHGQPPTDAERRRRRERAHARLRQAGAHYVVDTIADLTPCIDAVEARLTRGDKP